MTPKEEVDLYAPFTRDTILEVRSGKMKKYKGLNIESGIDKSLLNGPIHVGKLGIDGDEHDYTFHGGPDKAVHGCKSGSQKCYLFHVFFFTRSLDLCTSIQAPITQAHIHT